MQSWLSALTKRLFLISIGILAALLVLELCLRAVGFKSVITHQADDLYGHSLRPNLDGVYSLEGHSNFQTNSRGFRDIERTLTKPPDTFRIAVIGDSYIEALQVESSQMFTTQLQSLLEGCNKFGKKKIEVIPFGVSGYSPIQYLLLIQNEVLKYSPDLIILALMTGNDIKDSYQNTRTSPLGPFIKADTPEYELDYSFLQNDSYKFISSPLYKKITALSDHLRLLQLAKFLRDRIKFLIYSSQQSDSASPEAGLTNLIYSKAPPPEFEKAWQNTFKSLLEITRTLSASDIELLIISLTNGIQVSHDKEKQTKFLRDTAPSDLFEPERRIANFSAASNIRYLPLAATLAELARARNIQLHGFKGQNLGAGHWNQDGHHEGAKLVASYLCSGG